MKQADVNQACLCLAAFVPGTEVFKRAAERCCTLQLLAGDDLQSTQRAWHLATFDKPYNLLCRSLLLRYSQKPCQQTRVQKVRKVLYQNICLAFLGGKPTKSYQRGLGQILQHAQSFMAQVQSFAEKLCGVFYLGGQNRSSQQSLPPL